MGKDQFRRVVAPAVLALSLVLAIGVGPVAALTSDDDVVNAGPITQTHTLYYNTMTCYGGGWNLQTAYAFVNWNERMQKTAGAAREIDTAVYVTGISGVTCSGSTSDRGTGKARYYPRFGSKNDITWTLTLNWPYIVPVIYGAGSSQRVYYVIPGPGGGTAAEHPCNNIVIANNGNSCPTI